MVVMMMVMMRVVVMMIIRMRRVMMMIINATGLITGWIWALFSGSSVKEIWVRC